MKEICEKEVKDFLETAPMYTLEKYTQPIINGYTLYISAIDAFCATCNRVRPFHRNGSKASGGGATGSSTAYIREKIPPEKIHLSFTCVTCSKENREFHIEHIVDKQIIKLQKYGELPRKRIERDKGLQKFFSGDSEHYEKAVVCLSQGYGIGAFAYFRRIVENNISNLLDLIQEDAENASNKTEILAALEKLKVSYRCLENS